MRLGLGKELEIPLLVPRGQLDPAVLLQYIQRISDCDEPDKLESEVRAFCDSRNRLFQNITGGVYSEATCIAHSVQATRLQRALSGMGRTIDKLLLAWTYKGREQDFGICLEPAAARFAAAACVLRAGSEKMGNEDSANNAPEATQDPRVARLAAAAGHLYAAVRLANNSQNFLCGDASILASAARAKVAEIELVHSLATHAGNLEPFDKELAAALQSAKNVALSGLQMNGGAS